MEFNQSESVEVKVEVDVQEVVEIDEVDLEDPYVPPSESQQLHNETLNLHLQNSTELLQNILSGGDNNENGHTCPHCGKIYKTAITLNTHRQLLHPADEKSVLCELCNKVYPSALSLHKHVNYKHKYKYRCSACYKGFETQKRLDIHKETCGDYESKCPECGRFYTSQVAMRKHFEYKHPGNTEHWCFICRRSFKSTRGLINHNATVHLDGATVCVFCNRNFNSSATLQSHLLYKHREDGTRCKLCHKLFTSQASLTRHTLRNHHLPSKLYVCGGCTARFERATELQRHINDFHLNENNE